MSRTSSSISWWPRLRPWLLLIAAVSVAACGFQLRGQARLPAALSDTHLQIDDDSTVFARELRLLLVANGVRLAERSGEDTATLRIHSQRMWRQALSVSGQARVREFLLVLEVDFELADADGKRLLERETLRLTRDYSFDEQEILAADREEEFLSRDLGREMAARLMRRLESLSRS